VGHYIPPVMKIRIIPLVVATALFMENMDSTILATALPTIAADLGVDPISLKLAITSYLVGLAIFIPVSSWVADRLGARTTFRCALVIFLAASIGCAFSSTLFGFVVWRFVQGVGGAMMTPVGRMVIVRSVPKLELVSAMATLTIPALIGPMMGPLIGGAIVTYTDWRWIFLVNIPIGIVGIIMATLHFTDERPPATPLDVKGFLLCAVALLGLILGATALGRHVAPDWAIAVSFLVGAMAAFAYVRHAAAVAHPLLDLRLFELITFSAGIWGGSLFRIGVGAIAFLLPLMLQIGFGLDPLTSGMLTFASAIGALLMKVAGGTILNMFGFRNVVIVNGVLACASIAATGWFTAQTPQAVIVAVVVMTGLFRSLQFSSLHALSYADVATREAGAATSIASVAQQVSISMGVAVGALALELSQSFHQNLKPTAGDFSVAIYVVAAIASLSIIKLVGLPADAGHELTAGRARRQPPASPEA
jgi:EmrB/QacA subfamily drug resistance transporter